MLIKKTISIKLDINDVIGLATDLNRNLMNIISDRYIGICYQGCLIKSITRIVKHGTIEINQDGNPDMGHICVIFDVVGVQYSKGEIISGCNIDNVDAKNAIICSNENASIILLPHDTKIPLTSLRKDQKISIRVVESKYNIGARKISVMGWLMVPTRNCIIYKYTPKVTADTRSYLSDIIEAVKAEETKIQELKSKKPKGFEFFSQLLYAYPDEQKPPTGAKTASIFDVIDGKVKEGAFITRDPRIQPTSSSVHVYSATSSLPPGSKMHPEPNDKNILLILLGDYLNHLRAVREMVEVYDSPEMMTSHANLWRIYGKAKSS